MTKFKVTIRRLRKPFITLVQVSLGIETAIRAWALAVFEWQRIVHALTSNTCCDGIYWPQFIPMAEDWHGFLIAAFALAVLLCVDRECRSG